MPAAWPLVVQRLVSWLPTLPGWAGVVAHDGPEVTGDAPTDFVTVGYVPGEDFGGSYEQTYSPGGVLEELGTVRCEIVCWAGDDDLPGLRARAFALVDAWQAEVTRDGTLGVLTNGSSSLSVDVQPVQNSNGAAQRLTVTLSYSALS